MQSGSNNFFVRKVKPDHLRNLIVFKMTAHRFANIRVEARYIVGRRENISVKCPNGLTACRRGPHQKKFTHLKPLVKNSSPAQQTRPRERVQGMDLEYLPKTNHKLFVQELAQLNYAHL